MSSKQQTIKGLVELHKLVSLKILFLTMGALIAMWFLTLSLGPIADNAFHWIMIKLMAVLFIGMPFVFLFMFLAKLLPNSSRGSYLKFYRNSLPSEYGFRGLNDEQREKVKKHYELLEDVSLQLDRTPDDIRQLEKRVSSAERKIRVANRATSAAIGYGLGKKTEL